MNYSLTYEKLIARAKANPPVGYYELHHIVPRCLGGGNEQTNLIAMTARQHFVAHLLLAKIHGGKLIYAVHRMMTAQKLNARKYEWVKKDLSNVVSRQMTGNKFNLGRKLTKEQKDAISKRGSGRKASNETRANMSKAQKGLPSQIKGRTFGPRKKRKSQASRDQMREAMKALWVKRHAEGFKQATPRPRSAESNAKISAKKMGHQVSPETREKIRLAVLANIEKRRAEGYKYPANRKRRTPKENAVIINQTEKP